MARWAMVLTEDPPFGGLWCDQPALFLPASCPFSGHAARDRFPLRATSCRRTAKSSNSASMDGTQQSAIHQALVTVQQAVTSMTFPSCDQGDVIELIDRIEEQLHARHPNVPMMCTFLNSIARSLRAQPEARDVCLVIEDAIGAAGMPSTWQSGI